MKKRINSLLLTFASLLFLAGCGEEAPPEPDDPATAVEIATVSRGAISAENSASGQVVSGKQESVSVALSAHCKNVAVEVGDVVSAGQTLCTLDISATQANYDTAALSYANAQKSYNEQSALLRQQVAQAEKNLSDTKELFALGAASQAEIDSAQLALDNARATMSSTLDQLTLSMQNYKATMTQLASTLANIGSGGKVTAPISGVILSLSATENGFVSPSAPVATIASLSEMEVQVGVSEALVNKLQVGSQVSVAVDAAQATFQSTIHDLDRTPNANTHLYGVTVRIPASAAKGLMAGMFANVTFYTDTQSDVVIIPTEAIQTGMDSQYVYILDQDNIAHRVPVETGLVGDGVTEITAGLSGGETLVTVGQFYLSEGAPVRVVTSEVTP